MNSLRGGWAAFILPNLITIHVYPLFEQVCKLHHHYSYDMLAPQTL